MSITVVCVSPETARRNRPDLYAIAIHGRCSVCQGEICWRPTCPDGPRICRSCWLAAIDRDPENNVPTAVISDSESALRTMMGELAVVLKTHGSPKS